MKKPDNHYAVIILAGGHSSRMDYPKLWIKKEGSSFLSRIVDLYVQFGLTDIVVVINEKFTTKKWHCELYDIKQHAKIISNQHPEKGRLYSLQLGLNHTKSNHIFIHNVDTPFVENDILKQLSNNVELNGITIPSFKEKGGHPVIINSKVRSEIIINYQHYETLKEVFTHFPKKYVEVNSNSILMNINTPQELEKLSYELA